MRKALGGGSLQAVRKVEERRIEAMQGVTSGSRGGGKSSGGSKVYTGLAGLCHRYFFLDLFPQGDSDLNFYDRVLPLPPTTYFGNKSQLSHSMLRPVASSATMRCVCVCVGVCVCIYILI